MMLLSEIIIMFLESEDFAPSKQEQQCMNQPPVPKVLHDRVRKWAPNEAAFSDDSYPASSNSSSPGPLEHAPMQLPAFPVSLPLSPDFAIFMSLMQNLHGKFFDSLVSSKMFKSDDRNVELARVSFLNSQHFFQ